MTDAAERAHLAKMNAMASVLSDEFDSNGFALLVFPIGEAPTGRLTYVSNVGLASMVKAMKEFLLAVEPTLEKPELHLH